MEKLHFIGIGGDGMSALAKMFWQQRRPLQGSNIESNPRTAELRRLGIPVSLGHDPNHLSDASTVVYSSAIPEDNVEMQAARRRGLNILHRQEALAGLINGGCPQRMLGSTQRVLGIGVAGTHGKTTTAVMLATLLKATGRDPSYLIGAGCRALGGHAYWGGGDSLVLEVDESDGRFLQFHPDLAVVTNIGVDHLNHYRDHAEILGSFAQYLSQSERVVVCADDADCRSLLEKIPHALSYGVDGEADLVAEGVVERDFQTQFSLRFRGKRVGQARLSVPGVHNVRNALAALLAGREMGLSFEEMVPCLQGLQLPEHRFEVLAKNGIMVVDDYAHLPEQIEVNLRTIRANWRGRIIALFQPHRFSRMHHMWRRFAPAFAQADVVGITDIYPAFEAPVPGIHAHRLVEEVAGHAPEVRYLPQDDDVVAFLEHTVQPGDCVIGFGAGDLWQSLERFAQPSAQPSAQPWSRRVRPA